MVAIAYSVPKLLRLFLHFLKISAQEILKAADGHQQSLTWKAVGVETGLDQEFEYQRLELLLELNRVASTGARPAENSPSRARLAEQ
jgi:hypothetical protein